MTRQEIFREIDQERDYQEDKWGEDFDNKNTVNDWVTYITQYVSKAAPLQYSKEEFVNNMIKVAALAVAAIETIDRNGDISPRHYDKHTVKVD